MKRKGFELSISVIVTILISIVLLGMGIFLLNKFIGGAQEIKAELDDETDKQLSILLESGERVAVPFNSFTLRRGEQKVIGVGVLNMESDQDYSINVRISDAFNKSNSPIAGVDGSLWTRYDQSPVFIKKNEQFKAAVLFTVPKNATSGSYIFDVEVNYVGGVNIGQTYGTIKKIYIIVP